MSDNYWTRKLARQGISRRRVLGGAAMAGIGTASLALVGCGDDDDDDDDNGGDPTNTPAPGETPQPGASPTTDASAPQQGGTAHFVSANNTWDTFDVDRSRFSPVAWLMGMTNLGVMQWKSFTNGELEGGIAESHEQVDDTTINFTIRPNVFWHDKAARQPPKTSRSSSSATRTARRSMASMTRTSIARPPTRTSTTSKSSMHRR